MLEKALKSGEQKINSDGLKQTSEDAIYEKSYCFLVVLRSHAFSSTNKARLIKEQDIKSQANRSVPSVTLSSMS